MPSALYDAAGRPVALGKSLGRGGEGEVFAVPATPASVAKVYHRIPDRLHAEKISAMTAVARPELLQVAAWPTATLHASPYGQLAGLLMPLVDKHRELHVLYSPAHRRQAFPEASWDFLVHVAYNVSRAFATVHAAGHVMGDVNQKNVVVAHNGTVRLIDCDSFQIAANGRKFLCEVGVPDFTPPELQGKSFTGVVRTYNHDRFGLAVLIFHLLCMGRHPFVGIFRGGKGDMPMDKAIREGRYAYGRRAQQFEMASPPHSVAPFVLATSRIGEMFERAFELGNQPDRPSAEQWVDVLEELKKSLRRCSAHRGHVYAGSGCPWCAIERSGGPDFFIALAGQTVSAGRAFDLETLLRRAAQIPTPPQPVSAALLNPAKRPGVPAVDSKNHQMEAISIALYAAGVLSFMLMFAYGPICLLLAIGFAFAGSLSHRNVTDTQEAKNLRGAVEKAKTALNAKASDYARDVDTPAKKFHELVADLNMKQIRYRTLPGEHQKAKQDLVTNQRQHQLRHHLEKFYIRNAKIEGVGPQLKQMLLAFGIETAADIRRQAISKVPRFGPTRTGALLVWRQSIEARFVFNPNQGLDPADVAAVDRQFAATRQTLEMEMEAIVGQMRSVSNRAHAAKNVLWPQFQQAAETVALAKARAGIP